MDRTDTAATICGERPAAAHARRRPRMTAQNHRTTTRRHHMVNLIPWRRTPGVSIRRDEEAGFGLEDFRSELDRFFGRLMGRPLDLIGNKGATMLMAPSIDVSENDREIVITAEVPGVEPEDLDISLSDHVLSITGEKHQEAEQEEGDYYHCERSFGAFRRSIELPQTADLDTMEAEDRNGVVTIRIRKKAEAAPRRIEVKPSAGAKRESTKSAKPSA
jgi:HSP20 family protein